MKVTRTDQQRFQDEVVLKYTDVIGEKLGGKVLSFSDEFFAKAENLLKPTAPIRDATRFVHTGAWYDGWETRRHNTEESDWVVIKMGVSSAKLIGAEVDTAFFNGNHAPFITVEAAICTDENIDSAKWDLIIDKQECGPTQKHFFVRDEITETAYTHVRLKQYPDGGIARFRLYGKVVPIRPSDINTIIDLANVNNGGVVQAFSDQHFGSADNLLLPGRGHDMSDGWETKRSRSKGHIDWAVIALGDKTNIDHIVVDTAHFRGNFPQFIRIEGTYHEGETAPPLDEGWEIVVPQSKTGPDHEHSYEVQDKKAVFTHVKLVIIPDGGVKRVKVFGRVAH
ncbi:BA75_02403T0 [Komagataella pastoris]|uniref:allantoicase n=1 Tax=Komagataella pastoris TaxID=4922 RepID=A0A1B2JAT8_PICPA|nr:BA75_02403T0 [Komagataella pastoris]